MVSRSRSFPPSRVADGAVARWSDEAPALYARQVLLTEVGREGQERVLDAAAAVAGSGLAHRVAERYAERAGFASLVAGPIDRESLAPSAIVSTAAARDVLAGARAALAEFRRAALRVTPTERS